MVGHTATPLLICYSQSIVAFVVMGHAEVNRNIQSLRHAFKYEGYGKVVVTFMQAGSTCSFVFVAHVKHV